MIRQFICNDNLLLFAVQFFFKASYIRRKNHAQAYLHIFIKKVLRPAPSFYPCYQQYPFP